MGDLEQRLVGVEERIQTACNSCGRRRSEVTLVAVSKTRNFDEISSLSSLGISDFGENKLQEFLGKGVGDLPGLTWHYIGALQSNKAKKIAQNFNVVHSLDSVSSLVEAAKAATNCEFFVQVNLAKEPQKAGIFAEALDGLLERGLEYPTVRVTGLMTIGPQVESPEESRSLFRDLFELAQRHGLHKVSMGMSDDFEVAIQEGATHIRVGTAIFGPRPG